MTAEWVESVTGPLEPLAYHALDGRPGFKMALTVRDGRHLLFLGHLWHSGWTVLDVSDPRAPQLLTFVPGPPDTWTLQVDIRGDLLATSLEVVPERWGGDAAAPFAEGVALWDISRPEAPRQLSTFSTGFEGTHRNRFDDSGLLHLAARMPGYAGMILVLLDVADPVRPREVGRFAMPEQVPGGVDVTGAPLFGLHGPSIRVGDLAYLPYGNLGLVVVDVSDPRAVTLHGHLPLRPALGTQVAAHSAVPIPARNLLILNSEAIAEHAQESPNFTATVDISDPANPRTMGFFPLPVPPAGSATSSYAEKGGRFGPHNQAIGTGNPALFQDDHTTFLTYFNAGVRVYDTSNPRDVREVASLVPRRPARRVGPLPKELETQVEDVLVDSRGVVYFTEKNSGLYVAQWHGAA